MKSSAAEFASILLAHQSRVYSLALYYLRDAALAEDTAQDVFLELYRTMPDFASPAHLLAWLRRTTLHRCIDLSRKRRLRAESEWPEGDLPRSTEGSQDFLAVDRMRAAVARLPEGQRELVILRYLEDMQPAEIAETLQLPVNTVKSRLHRALEALRGRMLTRAGGAMR